MRRTVTLRTTLHALLAAPVLFTALPAVAEESPLVISIVSGLAPDDMLNVRATASPIGRLQMRLPNGSSVKNLGCNDVNGHQWCKVEDVDNPKVSGWAPARYLIPTNPAPVADATPLTDPVVAPAVAANKPAEPAASAPQTVATASDGAAPSAAPQQPSPAPPPDLAARLGSADHAAETAVNSAAAIGRAAMQDAYGLAFAAKDNQAAAEIPPDPAGQQPAQAQGPAQTADGHKPDAPAADTQATDTQTADATPTAAAVNDTADDTAAPVTGAIPVPTPRPEQAGAAQATNPKTTDTQAIDPRTVARVEPPTALARAPDATGEIPCARYVGQPMTRCEVSVLRNGGDKADVTVTWPDGGTRVISFYAGQPAGSNARSDFRFTREGSLSMIRVGVSERFEITDTLAFGD
ncbi:SH3 domain-containing protein [Mesorhizobium sp. PAMC28654]|uniref:SH3 domain-containing protein n=1 Tax=Mesorhizobium sp. PAMC28654 TaxID=2880934 RepID=UPI001D0A84F4|nr:SH3 domain-containing protein [Mesorhizobium sp. PAMC28654]UDL88856.1 SH3 domain-containing protein [Mesorhizobium sp. PAMC28654]